MNKRISKMDFSREVTFRLEELSVLRRDNIINHIDGCYEGYTVENYIDLDSWRDAVWSVFYEKPHLRPKELENAFGNLEELEYFLENSEVFDLCSLGDIWDEKVVTYHKETGNPIVEIHWSYQEGTSGTLGVWDSYENDGGRFSF